MKTVTKSLDMKISGLCYFWGIPDIYYRQLPHWQTEGYGVPFEFDQYEKMAILLKNIKGKAIVSLNDHPDIREVFKDFHIEQTDIRYTVGGGGGGASDSKVLIFSWDVKTQPSGLF